MAGRRRRTLGTLEARVMKVVWSRGRATVREVLGALRGGPRLAYTTILTTLRNLEGKGFLRHEVEGRAHVYLPAVGERAFTRFAARDLLDGLFDGSRARLVEALFDEEEISREEFEQLRREILALRKGGKGQGDA